MSVAQGRHYMTSDPIEFTCVCLFLFACACYWRWYWTKAFKRQLSDIFPRQSITTYHCQVIYISQSDSRTIKHKLLLPFGIACNWTWLRNPVLFVSPGSQHADIISRAKSPSNLVIRPNSRSIVPLTVDYHWFISFLDLCPFHCLSGFPPLVGLKVPKANH